MVFGYASVKILNFCNNQSNNQFSVAGNQLTVDGRQLTGNRFLAGIITDV
jgi:hypothetical protein